MLVSGDMSVAVIPKLASYACAAALSLMGVSMAAAQQTDLQPEIPTLKDKSGEILSNPVAGEMTIVSARINSNATQPENFIAVVEARNSIGITEMLEFQTGQTSGTGGVEVGISWTPEEPGSYELRTFLLSDLLEPQVLSGVSTKQITVEAK